jgi:hypothetical protein
MPYVSLIFLRALSDIQLASSVLFIFIIYILPQTPIFSQSEVPYNITMVLSLIDLDWW